MEYIDNAIRVEAWTGVEDSRRLRLPGFKKIQYMNVIRLSAHAPSVCSARKYLRHSFVLEAESATSPID